jgi:hypothetical protein
MLSLFFLSLIVSTSAFEVTLCDCTKHTGIGLLTVSMCRMIRRKVKKK